MRDSPGAGALAVLGAALLWGTIGVQSFGLFGLGVGPWEVAFWRAALSALALALWASVFRRDLWRLSSASDLGLLASFGVVGVGLFFASFQLANHLTSVAVAVVLLYTAPVLVLVGAYFLLGEPLGWRRALLGALVVAGVWATALGATDARVQLHPLGVGAGLLAAVSYAAYYLFGRRYLPRLGAPRIMLFSLLTGTVVLGVGAVLAGQPPSLRHPPAAWALLATLALGSTVLAQALYFWGLSRIEAGRAAVVASIEPVVAAALALLVFGQGLTWLGWLGVGLVAGGVAAASRLRR